MSDQFSDIKKFIPQREPMIMVDRLISHTATKTVSSFSILDDNLLLSNHSLSEAGLLENMAQTAAL
ncbi:MAG: ABC transporter permease, partial [Bacteroidales bacterium]|nr:ABC transporter permease [Bacteroidales bacterium]